MIRSRKSLLLVTLALPLCAPDRAHTQISAEQLDDRIRVTIGDRVFTEYRYAADGKLPYFYPIAGPRTGESVTVAGIQPYPHHSSLWFGADFVNGGNYWQEGLDRGRIVPERTRVVQAAGEALEIEQVNLWSRPGAESPIRDTRRIRITAPSEDLRVIDFDITLTPLIDVHIQKSNHSLFAARMAPALSVDSGGTLVNAAGDRGEAGTLGRPAPWADYWGSRNGVVEGLAILEHPSNRWAPSPWFTRNYGFFSPTPLNWLEDGVRLRQGEDLRLRYRVVVHGGDTDEARIGEMYREYAGIEF